MNDSLDGFFLRYTYKTAYLLLICYIDFSPGRSTCLLFLPDAFFGTPATIRARLLSSYARL